MSIFSLGWARNWKKYKYEMKKMNNEKSKKLKIMLTNNYSFKSYARHFYFPGQEVNQY